jgi:hypothetical protein
MIQSRFVHSEVIENTSFVVLLQDLLYSSSAVYHTAFGLGHAIHWLLDGIYSAPRKIFAQESPYNCM